MLRKRIFTVFPFQGRYAQSETLRLVIKEPFRQEEQSPDAKERAESRDKTGPDFWQQRRLDKLERVKKEADSSQKNQNGRAKPKNLLPTT